MTSEEKREKARLRAKQKIEQNNYYIETNCRFCLNKVFVKKYAESFNKKRGGGTCKDCQRRISTKSWLDYHSSKTKEQRSADAKLARSKVKSENLSNGVKKQWETFRSNPEKYKEICNARSKRMEKVWENYSDEQRNFIVKSLCDSNDCGRSKLSEEFKQELLKHNLYDGFKSEQIFHGFVPDEINENLKLIIEVFGDVYHCNPKKFKNPDVFINVIQRTVGEQWKRDEIKIAAYKKNGYEVLVVWESDIRKRLTETLEKVKVFIENRKREMIMAYVPHINNLYKDQELLMFKEAYALEKIHGTNAKIEYHPQTQELNFFSGGTKHETFVKLFDQEKLKAAFAAMGILDRDVVVFGESYGGKEQGMSHTYGTTAKFIVFDVKVGELWLDVPKAEKVAVDLGLEFVHYVKVPTDLSVLDAWRDAPSVQAIRNGVTSVVGYNVLDVTDGIVDHPLFGRLLNPKKREGIVLRPLVELRKNNGERLICKHKGDDFKETATTRPVVDPAKQKLLEDAQSVADDFVTPMRLQHVLDKLPGHCMEKMKDIIASMVEDVNREGKNEFVPSEAVNKAIGKKTAILYKDFLKSNIGK